MGFFSQVVVPRICDSLLNKSLLARHRRDLLSGAHGDVLEVGFGTGLNLPRKLSRRTGWVRGRSARSAPGCTDGCPHGHGACRGYSAAMWFSVQCRCLLSSSFRGGLLTPPDRTLYLQG